MIFLFLISNFLHAQRISIIPQPVSIKEGKGDFKLSEKTVIAVLDEEDKKAAGFINDYRQGQRLLQKILALFPTIFPAGAIMHSYSQMKLR